MRIPNVRPGEAARVRRTEKASGAEKGAFDKVLRSYVDTEVDGAPALDGVASIQGIDVLLALQEVDAVGSATGRDSSRKAPVRWAENVLDELDGLRVSLLSGAVPHEDLERIRSMVQRRRFESDDPRLLAILEEIELRAEVELAKFSKS